MVTELFVVLGPIMLVTLGALICIAAEAFLETEAKHRILPWIASVALALTGVSLLSGIGSEASTSIAGVLVMEAGRAWLLLGVAGCPLQHRCPAAWPDPFEICEWRILWDDVTRHRGYHGDGAIRRLSPALCWS